MDTVQKAAAVAGTFNDLKRPPSLHRIRELWSLQFDRSRSESERGEVRSELRQSFMELAECARGRTYGEFSIEAIGMRLTDCGRVSNEDKYVDHLLGRFWGRVALIPLMRSGIYPAAYVAGQLLERGMPFEFVLIEYQRDSGLCVSGEDMRLIKAMSKAVMFDDYIRTGGTLSKAGEKVERIGPSCLYYTEESDIVQGLAPKRFAGLVAR